METSRSLCFHDVIQFAYKVQRKEFSIEKMIWFLFDNQSAPSYMLSSPCCQSTPECSEQRIWNCVWDKWVLCLHCSGTCGIFYLQGCFSTPRLSGVKECNRLDFGSLATICPWSLSYLPDVLKAIKFQWVFKMKTNRDDSFEGNKEQVVVKGFLKLPDFCSGSKNHYLSSTPSRGSWVCNGFFPHLDFTAAFLKPKLHDNKVIYM